jgi:REP element-mobilizing transposase RayT
VLVTVRVTNDTSNLRRMSVYQAVRRALATALARLDFRVVHFSIQRNHIHFLAEADHQPALSKGMQGLLGSAAKRINAALGKRSLGKRGGCVFPDRYHERVITSPRQCRNGMRNVLNNWRRHHEDRERLPATWLVDPFSSGVNFAGWRELEGTDQLYGTPDGYERPPTSAPQTWLLTTGWKKHGTFSVYDVPGPAE